MHTGVQISLQDTGFISFGHRSRSVTAKSHDSSVFNFWRNLHALFQNDYTHYIPANGALRFPALHMVTNTCSLLSFPDSHPNICHLPPALPLEPAITSSQIWKGKGQKETCRSGSRSVCVWGEVLRGFLQEVVADRGPRGRRVFATRI